MRVTQSMLSNNMLRNLTTSYSKMGKLNDQLTTGKKVNRPSDDPVVAMRGLSYRMQVDKVSQYQRNIGEVNNWLDSTDDAMDKVGQTLQRTKELVTKAANDGALNPTDQKKIQAEIEQLREQVRDIANTKVGDKYIFSGTKTDTPLYKKDGEFVDLNENGFNEEVKINVFDGVELKVNSNVADMFKEIDDMFNVLTNENVEDINFSDELENIEDRMNRLLEERADVGARQNRAELMHDRLETQEGISKKQMSQNEDIDFEKVITEMLSQESVHRAALSIGSRIIQPSLVDFLR